MFGLKKNAEPEFKISKNTLKETTNNYIEKLELLNIPGVDQFIIELKDIARRLDDIKSETENYKTKEDKISSDLYDLLMKIPSDWKNLIEQAIERQESKRKVRTEFITSLINICGTKLKQDKISELWKELKIAWNTLLEQETTDDTEIQTVKHFWVKALYIVLLKAAEDGDCTLCTCINELKGLEYFIDMLNEWIKVQLKKKHDTEQDPAKKEKINDLINSDLDMENIEVWDILIGRNPYSSKIERKLTPKQKAKQVYNTFIHYGIALSSQKQNSICTIISIDNEEQSFESLDQITPQVQKSAKVLIVHKDFLDCDPKNWVSLETIVFTKGVAKVNWIYDSMKKLREIYFSENLQLELPLWAFGRFNNIETVYLDGAISKSIKSVLQDCRIQRIITKDSNCLADLQLTQYNYTQHRPLFEGVYTTSGERYGHIEVIDTHSNIKDIVFTEEKLKQIKSEYEAHGGISRLLYIKRCPGDVQVCPDSKNNNPSGR